MPSEKQLKYWKTLKGNKNGFKKGNQIGKANKGRKFEFKERPKAKGRVIWSKGTKGICKAWNKGKHLSETTKQKLRIALKGRKPNKGSFKKGIIPWQKGKQGRGGYLHHNWKGGISTANEKIRKSFKYRIWRDEIFERDNYICQMPDCDKTERYLNAHHIKLFSKFPELRFDINNGITLCKKCHNKTKGKEKIFEELFKNIILLKQSNELSN